MPKQNLFAQWSGCATYGQTIYLVKVIAPSGASHSEICTAINTARGFSPQVERDKQKSDVNPIEAPPPGAKFLVTFTPDNRYTINAYAKKEVVVPLKSSTMVLNDGHFMSHSHLSKHASSAPQGRVRR
ncbi:MAG: hypothetical protein PHF60_01050 [Candidatus ainarchaeum sp.]|nr:hypothetical protein [Candidatus ainarchaeum sp.]